MAAALVAAGGVYAQDITGIPNADVNPAYRSLSVRTAFAPADGASPAVFAQQFAYQHNFDESFSVQVGFNFGKRGPEAYEYKALQLIAEWQFAENERWGTDAAWLIVAKIPDGGDGPGRIASVLAAKRILHDVWEVRGAVATTVEFGVGAANGMGLNARLEATRRIGSKMRIGPQISDNFNTTAHFGRFSEQNHQAGLVIKRLASPHLAVNASALFGVSAAAPDEEFKLFLTYEL